MSSLSSVVLGLSCANPRFSSVRQIYALLFIWFSVECNQILLADTRAHTFKDTTLGCRDKVGVREKLESHMVVPWLRPSWEASLRSWHLDWDLNVDKEPVMWKSKEEHPSNENSDANSKVPKVRGANLHVRRTEKASIGNVGREADNNSNSDVLIND